MIAAALAAGWVAGCVRPLPDHLRVDAPAPLAPPTTPSAPPTDRDSALAAVLGADPLARRPAARDPAAFAAIPGADATRAFLTALRELDTGRDAVGPLAALEAALPGTEAVGLARGSRWRHADSVLHSTVLDAAAAHRAALSALTPLREGDPDTRGPLSPLDLLGGPEGLLRDGERWVLAGWLDGPDVPLGPVARALAPSPFDPLRERPLGRLIVARAEDRRADAAAAWADLERATHLSLVRVAADRDSEQGAWADERRAVATELGVQGDPVVALLNRAFDGLLADAGDPRSAGGALVAATALRIVGRCPDAPCAGVDRAVTLRRASSWHADVGRLGRAWEVVFWDQTLATLAAGRDTGLFATAVVDLADVLAGAGDPVDGALIARDHPDPTVWLIAGRAVGVDGVVDWPDASVALGKHLQAAATAAAAESSPEDRGLCERIAKRAVP